MLRAHFSLYLMWSHKKHFIKRGQINELNKQSKKKKKKKNAHMKQNTIIIRKKLCLKFVFFFQTKKKTYYAPHSLEERLLYF